MNKQFEHNHEFYELTKKVDNCFNAPDPNGKDDLFHLIDELHRKADEILRTRYDIRDHRSLVNLLSDPAYDPKVGSIRSVSYTHLLIQEFEIDNYCIHPVFTGKNLNFFEENVYTDTEDIFSNPLPFHRIFAHQKLNTNFFGQLTVFPNGAIYANVNSPSLGNAGTDTLLDIDVYKRQIWY